MKTIEERLDFYIMLAKDEIRRIDKKIAASPTSKNLDFWKSDKEYQEDTLRLLTKIKTGEDPA